MVNHDVQLTNTMTLVLPLVSYKDTCDETEGIDCGLIRDTGGTGGGVLSGFC